MHLYSQRAVVISTQEGVSSRSDSEVTAPCVHKDVQLMRQRERGRERGGENSLSNTCCELSAEINMFVKLTLGLHCEID